MSLQVYTGNIW